MSKKQLIGLVIAGLVFTFVCSASVYMNRWSKEQAKTSISMMEDYMNNPHDFPMSPYVGLVDVEGTIVDTGTTDMFGNPVGYNHQYTLNYVDDMIDSDNNRGIILYVNSPGGSVYDSDELYLKLKEYTEKTGRPVWAYMADEACSGGYYISMAAEKVYANRNTMTGSIGVIISMTNYKELFDKIGLKEIYITSGKNKSMGAGDENLSDEQRSILQSYVDEAYEQFTGIVADGRKLPLDEVKRLADGRIYSAKQALNNKLIDGIATYDEMLGYFSDEIGDFEVYSPYKQSVFNLSSLFGAAQNFFKRSSADVISEFLETNGSGVPMYYAVPGQY